MKGYIGKTNRSNIKQQKNQCVFIAFMPKNDIKKLDIFADKDPFMAKTTNINTN